MRTYSARDVEDDINHVEWVPADVARGLYDALKVAVGTDQLQGGTWERMARKALAAADGEEV